MSSGIRKDRAGVFGWFGIANHRGTNPVRVYYTAGSLTAMTREVEVDARLAERATEVAATRGETIEAVIERALQAYVRDTNPDTLSE